MSGKLTSDMIHWRIGNAIASQPGVAGEVLRSVGRDLSVWFRQVHWLGRPRGGRWPYFKDLYRPHEAVNRRTGLCVRMDFDDCARRAYWYERLADRMVLASQTNRSFNLQEDIRWSDG